MRIAKREKIWRISYLERRDFGQEAFRGFLLEQDPCIKVRAHFPRGFVKKGRLPNGAFP